MRMHVLRAGTAAPASLLVALVLSGCGGEAAQAPLNQTERVERAKAGTVSITGKSTQVVDDEGTKEVVESGGSGVLLDAKRGLALTNSHVVTGLKAIRTRVGDAESPVQVLGQAPCQDLAVVRLTAPLPAARALKLGDSDRVKAGQHVTAVGYPGDIGEAEDFEDRAYSATEGTVSVAKTEVQAGADIPALRSVIRHQVPISGGNSRGALIADGLEVVGINTLSGQSEQGNVQSQNISITSNQVTTILPQLMSGKDEAYVGWNLSESTLEDGTAFLAVEGVDAGSPAAKGGFVEGDVITELDGTPVANKGEVCEVLESKVPGEQFTASGLDAARDGAPFEGAKVRVKR